MDRPKLRFRNAVRTAEVERRGALRRRALRLASPEILEDGIDFLLAELSVHLRLAQIVE
jgi:hypothetical protein